ncbi:hypothetical protein NQ314_005067, partial [Rhamnusium bicolor]
AGVPETLLMSVPNTAASFQNTEYDWRDLMEYQPNVCLGLESHKMAWPRGRALGGTSVINYMIYTRGNKWDHDNWAAQGNAVLPYYLKSERARLRKADYRYHNTNGYLAVEDTYQSPLVEAFIEGGKELGLPYWDYSTPTSSFGVSTVQATVRNGRRASAAYSFLWPIRNRPNLDIMTSAFVTKILIDENTRKAYGVKYDRFGKTYEVFAEKEIILSAGAFNSPQLLMLSGIGPREHLEELGIPLLQDSPVGQNLHDHLTFPGLSFLINQNINMEMISALATTGEFLKNGTGPMTSLGGVEGIGYIKTSVSRNVQDQPDIELIFVGGSLASDYGLITRVGMRIRDDVYDSIFRPLHFKHYWTIFPMLLHPKSIGWLKLRTANPYDRPLFYGNFFTDPNNEDIQTFIAAIRFIQRLSNTAAFQKYGSYLNPRPMAGCKHLTFDSDQYWECTLRSIAVTLHHQVGTVKMGPSNDSTAVVNNRLQVYGIDRLRVADCSIIPFALSAHTNAPSIMVGEKAADIIKEFWGQPIKS